MVTFVEAHHSNSSPVVSTSTVPSSPEWSVVTTGPSVQLKEMGVEVGWGGRERESQRGQVICQGEFTVGPGCRGQSHDLLSQA